MGGTVYFDASAEKDVRVEVVLPVEIQSASGVPELAAAPRPAMIDLKARICKRC
jgi:hypothetical protein